MFNWIKKIFCERPETEYKLMKQKNITHDLTATMEEIKISKKQYNRIKHDLKATR